MLWVLLLVIIFMVAAVVLRLVFQVREQGAGPGFTEHFYALSATAAAVPTIDELVDALEEHGYDLTYEKTTTRNLSGDVSLDIGGELILRDRRQRGALSVRISLQGERVTGELVSKDEGPEFYEEMARYALVALSLKIPELRYAHRGQDPAPAASLAGELPERPLGMALL
jgi:hypothetical protein